LRTNLGTLSAAIDGVLGHPLEIRLRVENGRAPAPDVEPNAEPDSGALMRYAIDTLPS
jgi:hypothetical protein